MLIKFEVNMKLSVICLLCLLSERLEQVLDAVRGECRLTKDTHDFKDGPTNLEVVLDDGNEAVCDDGNMNLYSLWHIDLFQRFCLYIVAKEHLVLWLFVVNQMFCIIINRYQKFTRIW